MPGYRYRIAHGSTSTSGDACPNYSTYTGYSHSKVLPDGPQNHLQSVFLHYFDFSIRYLWWHPHLLRETLTQIRSYLKRLNPLKPTFSAFSSMQDYYYSQRQSATIVP